MHKKAPSFHSVASGLSRSRGLQTALPSLPSALCRLVPPFLLLAFTSAGASTVFWDINGATAGSSANTQVAGTWNAANTLWSADSTGSSTTSVWVAGNDAVFSAGTNATGTSTITVSGTQSVSSITVEEGALSFSGTGTITFSDSTPDFIVGNGLTATATSVLAGTNGVQLSGGGTLVLSGANTYTGTTNISAGILQLGNSNRIVDTSDVVFADVTGAAFNLNNFNETVGSLSGGGANGGNITLGSGTLTTSTSANTTYGGLISGTGGFTKTGTGTLTLSNDANTYTGITTISGGTLAVTSLANGGMASSIGAATNAATNLVLSNGTLQYNGGSVATDQNFTLTAATTNGINIASPSTVLILSGASANTTGALTKTGSGTLILGGNNLHTGNTTISEGKLQLGTGGHIADTSNLIFANTAGAVFDLNIFNETVGSLSGGGASGGDIALGTGTLTTSTAANTTYAGAISGSGGLIKLGTGDLTLSGVSSYTGTTAISAGTIIATTSTALGDTTGGTTVTSGATLGLQGGITIGNEALSLAGTGDGSVGALRNISGNNSLGGPVTMTAATTLQIDSGNLTLGGGISGAFALTKTGAGDLTLGGASTYTGGTSFSAGTLYATNTTGSATGTGILTLSTAGTTLAGTGTVGTVIASAGGTHISPGVNSTGTLTTGALTLGDTTQLDFGLGTTSDRVQVNGALVLDGVLNLTNAGGFGVGSPYRLFDYTGSALGAAAAATVQLGSVPMGYDYTVSTATAQQVNLTVSPTGKAYWDGSGSNNTTVQGGTGIWNAANTNWTTSSGAGNGTWVDNLTPVFQASAGTVNIDPIAPVNVHGMEFNTAGYTVTGSTINLTDTSAINTTHTAITTTTIASILAGTNGLTKTGTGILALTGTNTWTGGTTISAGTLQVGTGGTTGTLGSGNIVDNGTLAFNRSDDLTVSNIISGTGALTKSGAGTLTLSGNNSYDGATTISAGTVLVTSNTALGSSVGGTTLAIGASLDLQGGVNLGGENITLNGTSSNNAHIHSLTGSNVIGGTVTLNTLPGDAPIVVNSGAALTLGNIVLATNSLQQVNNNGTLNLTGNVSSPLASAGGWNLGGTGTYNLSGTTASNIGTTDVTGSTLNLTGTIGGSVILSGGSTLIGTGTIAGDLAYRGNASPRVHVAPGSAAGQVGTLTVNGNWDFATGFLDLDLGAPNASDKVLVGGVLQNASTSSINFNFLPGFTESSIYTLIDYGSGTPTIPKLGTVPLGYDGLSITNDAVNTRIVLNSGMFTGAAYWDGTDSAADGTVDGGTSTWNATSSNWTNSTGGANSLWVDNFMPTFAGAAGTVTVAAPVSVHGIEFATTGYTLTGSTITLGDSSPVNVGVATATIASTLAGTSGLTKTGSGILNLSGPNTYTGPTAINSGTVAISSATALGATADGTTVASGAALALSGGITVGAEPLILNGTGVSSGGALQNTSGTNTFGGPITLATASEIQSSAGTLTLSGNINNSGNTLTVDGAGATTSTGIISGSGGLTKIGNGTLTVSGANTWTGGTSISAGTLALGANNTLPDTTAVTVASGATFNVNGKTDTIGSLAGAGSVTLGAGALTAGGNNTSTALSGVMSGSGTFTKAGAGTFTLSGDNTYTGTTSVQQGTLVISGQTASATINTASGATTELNVSTGTRDNTAGTTFTGTGTLAKTGAGATSWGPSVLTMAMGSDALLDIRQGTFNGGFNSNDVWTNNLSDVNIAAGATFNAGAANARVDVITGSGTITTGFSVASYQNLTIGVDNGTGVFTGIIADNTTAGNLVKTGTGTGTQTLAGASTYTGTTSIQQGTLQVTNTTGSGTGTGATTVSSGATLAGTGILTGTTTVLDGGHLSPGLITGVPGLLTLGSTILNNASQIDFGLGNTSDKVKTNGNLTLDGILNVANTGGFGSASIYRLFDYTGTLTDNTLSLGSVPAGYDYLVTKDTVNKHVDLGLTGTGTAYWDGIAANTTTVEGGTAHWTAGTTNPTNWTNSGGTQNGYWIDNLKPVFQGAAGTVTVDQPVSVHGMDFNTGGYNLTNSIITLGDTAPINTNNAGNTTIASVLAGSSGLTKTGTGTLTLSGPNTWTGPTAISAGTLALGADNTLPDNSPVTLSSGTTFNVNGKTDTIGSLAGAGAVTLAGGQLSAGADNTSTTYSGPMSGAGTFTKTGTGILTLSGTAAPGTMQIAGGTVKSGGSNVLGDTTSLRFSGPGGTWNTDGFSDTLGTLDIVSLTGGAAVDFGGGASILHFADSSSSLWSGSASPLLSLSNWSGNFNTGGGTDQLFFGSSASGLTADQVSKIQFVNPSGMTGIFPAQLLPTGELVPVPEPSSRLTLAALFSLICFRRKRRASANPGSLI